MPLRIMLNKGKNKTLEIVQELKLILKNPDLNLDQKEKLDKIIKDTIEFIKYNEWGVGLECMSDNLYEFSIPLNQEIVNKTKEACKIGRLQDHYYTSLEELVN